MRVFHYKISLLPRTYFERDVPASLSEAEVDRSDWWASHPPSESLLSVLRTLLPHDRSWGETEEYVSSDGDWSSDIRIWKDDDGQVDDIVFRFSPVDDGWSLMQAFIRMAQEEQCVLLEHESGLILNADEEAVVQNFAVSRAVEFLRDPKGAIVRATKKVKENAG